MAGPCSVESAEQVAIVASSVAGSGARVLRGGAFKPRTSPYAFQGHGEEALKWMRAAADETGLAVISEVMDPRQIEMMMRYVDCLQVGARNMQNFDLLKELGRVRKPVLLKRGLSVTIEEWLLSAEYILAGGNGQVILCERGIRTFETYTRNTLDISAIPVVKKRSHLPIVVDPSHGTGRRDKVIPMARAAVAAGADGADHRGPQQPGEGALGRPAEPLPGAVRPADERAADHRPGAGEDAAAREGDGPERVRPGWLAGHPPLLHWRSALRSVARLEERGIALGIRPGERYPLATVDVSSGDVLVALTDGVTETADALDRELGLEPVERALAAHATEPLPELLERLLELARGHGAQQDDRTLLLARVLAG